MRTLFGDDAEEQDGPAKGGGAKGGGWVLAHCDGGARGNPGPAGFGAVVADEQGVVLAELSEFLGFRTNNYAEYAGLLAVLQWAIETGHGRVRLVSDSLLMVKQIQGKFKVASPDLRPLWEEARRRIAKLDGFEISHALRHKNKAADRLANEAMDRGMGKTGNREQGAGGSEVVARPYPAKGEAPAAPRNLEGGMVRGFVKGGVVHLLGGKVLPEGVFVKVVVE